MIKVWSLFNCNTLEDYLLLYLKVDVLLLTDVFENFRMMGQVHFGLCPLHFRTLPGYSFEAMKKKTDVVLELIRDPEIFTMFKNGIRGGNCFCNYRHLKANNKYMANFDNNLPESYLWYIDANNLYGKAMIQKLPIGRFEILDLENDNIFAENMSSEQILNIESDGFYGYMLEIDAHVPKELHDFFNDFPFFPQKQSFSEKSKTKKLISSLYPVENYVLHIKMLQLALKCGIVLDKIHKVVRFQQSAWLQPYIIGNNDMRTMSKTKFEKDFWKLLNNSTFGKFIESVEKYRDVKFPTCWKSYGNYKGAEKFISSNYFKGFKILDENLIVVEMKRKQVYYNKPIAVGCSILELSKVHMYNFFYSALKPALPNALLAYEDTDSLTVVLEGANLYEKIKPIVHDWLDTSNYPENNIFGIPLCNKGKLGYFKDELAGKIMTEFIGLNPKTYAFSVENTDEIKKAKGVKKCVTRDLRLEDYKKCLKNQETMYRKMAIFKSELHQIQTKIINKAALTVTDDKRVILPNKTTTLAYGHYRMEELIIEDLENIICMSDSDNEN